MSITSCGNSAAPRGSRLLSIGQRWEGRHVTEGGSENPSQASMAPRSPPALYCEPQKLVPPEKGGFSIGFLLLLVLIYLGFSSLGWSTPTQGIRGG